MGEKGGGREGDKREGEKENRREGKGGDGREELCSCKNFLKLP